MQGVMSVSSELGRGTTISFSITIQGAAGAAGVPGASVMPGAATVQGATGSAASDGASGAGTTVLLIDEAGVRREATAGRLGALGFVVLTAASVAEGLERAGVTDNVRLVVAEGDVCGDVQQLTARNMGVVLLKHQGMEVVLADAGGNVAVLDKPYRQHQLSDTCNALLRSSIQTQTKPMRILVAEDHPVNQKLAIRVLERLGYNADIVANGKEVLEAMAAQVYDLVFMDVQMPELDGLEATRLIRASDQQQPVIVAMTANAMNGDRDECLQAGMDDYICKPLNLDELAGLLQKWQAALDTKHL
jgi:CheY-like chemotaxis protein